MIWNNGTSQIALGATFSGRGLGSGSPPPAAGSPHLTPGTSTGTLGASIELIFEMQDNHAPQHVAFTTNVTNAPVAAGTSTEYDPQGQVLQYVHRITRDGDAAWEMSDWQAPLRGIPGMYAKGVQFEKRWAMIFDLPGTYRIITTVINPATGERATSPTYTYTVNDPNTVFTTAQTFVVAFDSNFTGAPAAAGNYSTMGAARSAINAVNPVRARILVKRGTTTSTDWDTISHRDNLTNMIGLTYGTWGGGARPLFNASLLHNLPTRSGVRRAIRMSGWEWAGTWDQGTATGTIPLIRFLDETNLDILIHDCIVRNSSGIPEARANTLGICDTVFENYYTTGSLYSDQSDNSDIFNLMGVRSYDPSNAFVMANGSQNGGFGFRAKNPKVISQAVQSDFFQLKSNSFTSAGGYPAQSPLRLMAQQTVGGCYINLNRCVMEGGGTGAGSGTSGTSRVPTTINMRSNIHITTRELPAILVNNTGVLVENSFLVTPPNRHSTWNGSAAMPSNAWFIEYFNETALPFVGSARDNEILVRHCTAIDMRDRTVGRDTFRMTGGTGGTPTLTELNNLEHAPYAGTPKNVGPFTAGSLQAGPRNGGFRINISPVQTNVEPRTVTPTHYVDVSGPSGTFGEGSAGSPVTLTAPGTVTGKVAQTHLIGSLRRLWLYDVTGAIANGATVTVSGGGTGTASGAMVAAGFDSAWQPVTPPTPDAGAFTRLTFLGNLNTTSRKGVVLDVA